LTALLCCLVLVVARSSLLCECLKQEVQAKEAELRQERENLAGQVQATTDAEAGWAAERAKVEALDSSALSLTSQLQASQQSLEQAKQEAAAGATRASESLGSLQAAWEGEQQQRREAEQAAAALQEQLGALGSELEASRVRQEQEGASLAGLQQSLAASRAAQEGQSQQCRALALRVEE
jgi:predicted  nucleic acid-binding Zn-ribbon protein